MIDRDALAANIYIEHLVKSGPQTPTERRAAATQAFALADAFMVELNAVHRREAHMATLPKEEDFVGPD